MTTRNQLIQNYKASEKRAVVCATGLAFSVEDRIALTLQRRALGMSCSEAAWTVATHGAEAAKAVSRFNFWEEQMQRGEIRTAPPATGEHIGKGRDKENTPFEGRIKTINDVQPAFNRAARQLIKVGITSPEQALKYVSAAFATARVEQKIDLKADRIVKELQMGDLTKAEVLITLERVKQSF